MSGNSVAKELMNLKKAVERLILTTGMVSKTILDHARRLKEIEEKLGIKLEDEEIPEVEWGE